MNISKFIIVLASLGGLFFLATQVTKKTPKPIDAMSLVELEEQARLVAAKTPQPILNEADVVLMPFFRSGVVMGLRVVSLRQSGRLAAMGLKEQDVILSVDGLRAGESPEINAEIESVLTGAASPSYIKISRDSVELTFGSIRISPENIH